MHAYDTAGWVPYFAAMVGATAALTGLLFVAVSLNLDKIVKGPAFLPHRAAETLGTLLLVLYASALVLVPQNIRALGIEILIGVLPLQFLDPAQPAPLQAHTRRATRCSGSCRA